jgi:hypothetical protein
MKNIILLILVIYIASPLSAQQTDNLEPDASTLTDFDHSADYKLLIKKFLFDSLSIFPMARTLVCPSFGPEYVISFEDQNINNTNLNRSILMIFRISNPSIWDLNSKNKISSIHVKSKKINVDYTFANLIEKVFTEAILRSSFKDSFTGVDGNEYYYMITKPFQGIHCAKVWSPRENTKMYELKLISELLREFAETTNLEIKNEIIKRSNNLLIRFDQTK